MNTYEIIFEEIILFKGLLKKFYKPTYETIYIVAKDGIDAMRIIKEKYPNKRVFKISKTS